MCLYCGDIVHDLEGADGLPRFNGSGAATASVTATSSQDINGLLETTRWSSLSQTFGFTVAAADYGAYSHTVNGATVDETTTFSAVTVAMQTAARASFSMINAYTDLNMTESATPSTATMRLGMSNNADGSAYAYFPSSHFTGGDIWFGKQTGDADVRSPVIGNYSWLTHMHEIGHALGLKHGHETGGVSNVAMTSFYDRMEYSIMTYRSYLNEVIGGSGYQNETFGYAQTFMMYDIAALQHMYGADFTSVGANVGNSNYSFSSTTGEMFINGVGQGQPGANRIFRTVWDGGGNDTYDFSNFATNMTIDLRPGKHSVLSTAQLASLGGGNFAQGNLYNALQYQSDNRSLIENAVGGSGADLIFGNNISNYIYGGNGGDTIIGLAGADQIAGEGGNDYVLGGDEGDGISGGIGNDSLSGDGGNDYILGEVDDDALAGGAGGDVIDGGTGNDVLWGHDPSGAGDLADYINGNDGNDIIVGHDGNDEIHGGVGQDTINGGNGADAIFGEAGNDELYGLAGGDAFIFNSVSFGLDNIWDFTPGQDKIYVSTAVFSNFAEVQASAVGGAGFVRITDAGGLGQITLQGFGLAALNSADWVFI